MSGFASSLPFTHAATQRLLAAEVLALMKFVNGRRSEKSLRHVMYNYTSDDLRRLRDQLSSQSRFAPQQSTGGAA